MKFLLTTFSSLATVSFAAPLDRRADIAHDAVVGFAQTVPSTTEGTLMLKYQPYLYVVDGCVPFPAVDEDGNTRYPAYSSLHPQRNILTPLSAGLAPSGDPSGDCSSSTGQIYARAETYDGSYAIMYSWYFPKDEPSWLESLVGVGHRYDWEAAVVWLSDATEDATFLGAAASYHGDYVTSTDPTLSGDHPLIQYYTAYAILDHSLGFTDTVGGMQPLVAWESLPSVAQTALAEKDWVGKLRLAGTGVVCYGDVWTDEITDANVPFIDANFEANLAEAVL